MSGHHTIKDSTALHPNLELPDSQGTASTRRRPDATVATTIATWARSSHPMNSDAPRFSVTIAQLLLLIAVEDAKEYLWKTTKRTEEKEVAGARML